MVLSAGNKIMGTTDTDPALMGKEMSNYIKEQEVLRGHTDRTESPEKEQPNQEMNEAKLSRDNGVYSEM